MKRDRSDSKDDSKDDISKTPKIDEKLTSGLKEIERGLRGQIFDLNRLRRKIEGTASDHESDDSDNDDDECCHEMCPHIGDMQHFADFLSEHPDAYHGDERFTLDEETISAYLDPEDPDKCWFSYLQRKGHGSISARNMKLLGEFLIKVATGKPLENPREMAKKELDQWIKEQREKDPTPNPILASFEEKLKQME
jgi:hypothetical protein